MADLTKDERLRADVDIQHAQFQAMSHDGGNDVEDPEPPRVDWLHERVARLAAVREGA